MTLRSTSLRSLRALTLFLLSGSLICVAHSSSAQQEVAQDSSGTAKSAVQLPASKADEQDYIISPDDLLDVYVVDVAELSRSCRVNPSGTVTLPLVSKPLTAAGLSLAEFADAIGAQLKSEGLVSNPRVTVSVQQSRLHSVAITGAVKHPQIYSVLGKTTLLDVLSQAEGLADDASNFALIRRGPIATRALGLDSRPMTPQDREAQLAFTVDTRRVMESTDPGANIDIYPGDSITIPRAGIVYVVGAVNKPGGFTMKPGKQGMTVLQAVALAEDLKSTAVSSKSVLLRTDAESPDGRKQISIDLKKLLAGRTKDVMLQADDILFVPDSPSKKAFRRGIESALQVATGLVIYRR